MGIKGRRSYHRLTDKDFSTIKTLLEAKLGVSKIHDITGRSFGVIGIVRNSVSYNDYRSQVRAITDKNSKKIIDSGEKEILEKAGTIWNTGKSGKSNTDEIVEVLKNINTSLERLATAWENRPIKKGLFER